MRVLVETLLSGGVPTPEDISALPHLDWPQQLSLDGIAAQLPLASCPVALLSPQSSAGDLRPQQHDASFVPHSQSALAQASRAIVAADTGPLHLAGAVGTPAVALFGPTDPERNGPWSAADRFRGGT